MRIVSKAELMTMPKGTPFCELREGRWPEGLDIFDSPSADLSDFYYRSLNNPTNNGSTQLFNRQHHLVNDRASYPVDLSIDREGLYDDTLRYLIWEPNDVTRIINLLQGNDDPHD